MRAKDVLALMSSIDRIGAILDPILEKGVDPNNVRVSDALKELHDMTKIILDQ